MFPQRFHRRKFLKIIGFSMIGSIGYGSYSLLNKKVEKASWNGTVLNTPAKIEIHSLNAKKNKKILSEVDMLVEKYDSIFNLQNVASEINKLNSTKKLLNPSFELLDVVQKSLLLSDITNGSFDITVQPLWDFYYAHYIIEQNKNPPNKRNLNNIVDLVNWKNVILNDNSIELINNASITLNGIAQGWITDEITDLLKSYDIENTLVDFGENYVLGLYENSRPWNILLQGPENITKVLSLSNSAIATSGGYGTIFEPSATYHHIFDAKTGLSANNFRAVSVLSDKAWLSDGISTSALSMKKKQLLNVSKRFNSTVYIVEKQKFELLI